MSKMRISIAFSKLNLMNYHCRILHSPYSSISRSMMKISSLVSARCAVLINLFKDPLLMNPVLPSLEGESEALENADCDYERLLLKVRARVYRLPW